MSRYIIRKEGKYGFINEHGEEIIKPQFEQVFDFSEGVAWAAMVNNDKQFSGFINEMGDWVIEPAFSGYGFFGREKSLFFNGLAPIQAHNNKKMFIDKKGNSVTDPIYDKAYCFSENRALVSLNGLFGYIDQHGNQIIKCVYGVGNFEEDSRFSAGLAAVRFKKDTEGDDGEGDFGYIDVNGNTVFEPEDYYANAFSEGFAMVRNRFDYYFIDQEGQIPFEITTQLATSFSEGFADIYDSETECIGFINTNGEWIIKPQFKSSLRFTEGLAGVKRVGVKEYGYIDITGQIVITEKFKIALPFKNGLAYVEQRDKKGYINKSGEFVWVSK